VRIRIGREYAVHARHIADALGQAPLCVVTGPRRFGKTTSLLPALATLLERRGSTAHILNGRDYEHEPFSVRTLPPESYDALVIDEANVVTRATEATKEVLRLLHTKADAIVSMITFDAGYEPGAMVLARIWQDAEKAISGHAVSLVRLPQMIVNRDAAQDLLTLYSPVTNEAMRARVITYIVQRVPLNPHVLLELSGAHSVAEVNTIVRQRRRTLFQGALSPDEYRDLEQSLQDHL
jgi:hypothetical protein